MDDSPYDHQSSVLVFIEEAIFFERPITPSWGIG
jgi:hypothetical protein